MTDKTTFYHLITDDKFLDSAISRFETVAPGAHRYYLIGHIRPFHYLKYTRVEFIGMPELLTLVASNECQYLIFHSFPPQGHQILRKINPLAKVVWLGWGFDYYDLLLSKFYPDGLELRKTKDITKAMERRVSKSWILMKCREAKIRSKVLAKRLRTDLGYISRIDYFIPVLEREFKMAKQAHPYLRAQYIPWNYQISIDPEHETEIAEDPLDAQDILIGNSATPTNNHADILYWLKETTPLSGRKLVVPLNYGNEHYAREIIKLGQSLFGGDFIPIIEWLPLDAYYEILKQCGFGIFGHLRQQGAGAVNRMLRQGSRIYMHSSSPLYMTYLDRGAEVSSFDEALRNHVPMDFRPLSPEEASRNLRSVNLQLEYPPQFHRTKNLIETITHSGQSC